MDAHSVVTGSRRLAWWRTGLVAAAVLALLGTTAVGVATLRDDGLDDPAAATASDPTSGEPGTADPTEPEDVGQTLTGPPPPPDPGWRYVSYRDVVVQVPGSWAYAQAPGADWCAFDQGPGEPPFPTESYVALPGNYALELSIGCPTDAAPGGDRDFESVPPEYWAPHLDFSDLGDRNWPGESVLTAQSAGSWTFTETRVGDVVLTLLTNPETAPLAERIIASARQVETDHNGCQTLSPAQAKEFVRPQPAFDISTIESVDAISVCQYDRADGTRRPGLIGSRLLTGAEAQAQLEAIQRAPVGGGPDTPESCVDDMFGDTALVLRLHEGETTYDLHVYYEWCFGNGFDDGTAMRELTEDACVPLWGGPVVFPAGSTAPYRRCHA
jgi:hypothetical protein